MYFSIAEIRPVSRSLRCPLFLLSLSLSLTPLSPARHRDRVSSLGRQTAPLNIDVTLCVLEWNVMAKARSSRLKNVLICVFNLSIAGTDFTDVNIKSDLNKILSSFFAILIYPQLRNGFHIFYSTKVTASCHNCEPLLTSLRSNWLCTCY